MEQPRGGEDVPGGGGCAGDDELFVVPRVFDHDEEGGGANGAPYFYHFIVARSRSMDNEAA